MSKRGKGVSALSIDHSSLQMASCSDDEDLNSEEHELDLQVQWEIDSTLWSTLGSKDQSSPISYYVYKREKREGESNQSFPLKEQLLRGADYEDMLEDEEMDEDYAMDGKSERERGEMTYQWPTHSLLVSFPVYLSLDGHTIPHLELFPSFLH